MKFIALFLFVVTKALAGTASSGNPGDVQSAINAARDGDTVVIPSGSYNWTSGINCNKAITIDGRGAVTITNKAGGATLFNLTLSPNGHVTLAGIQFRNAGGTGVYVFVGGSGQFPVMHDCTFNVPNWELAEAIDWNVTGGLVYACTFESTSDGGGGGPGTGSGCFRIRSGYNFYEPSTFGNLDKNGALNLYVEDCTVRNIYNQAIDADDNTRIVIRHCDLINSQVVGHGITGQWGSRQIEIYDCKLQYVKQPPNSSGIVWVALNRYLWVRAGTGRVHDNTVDRIDSGGYWGGGKVSWQFIDEPLTRSGAGNGGVCESEALYPGTRWPGTGSNGTKYPTGQIVSPSVVDPYYVWNNTGSGAESWGTNDQTGDTRNCNGGSTANVFRLGRDIYFSAPPQKNGYEPYTYPHPLRGGVPLPSPTPTASPTPSATATPPVPSPTPTPTASPTPSASPTYRKWYDKQAEWLKNNPPTPDTP